MFKHLVVPVDDFSIQEHDFSQLRDLALRDDAKVTFVHVSDPLPPAFYLQNGLGGDYITVPDHKKACDTYAKRLFKKADQMMGPLVRTNAMHVFHADTTQGIVQATENAGADAILMISHKRSGLGGLLMGSETRDVMRKANVPIVVL